jgi:hypothetical protein
VAELQEAAEREERGEPAHLAEAIARLSRVAIGRSTALEELTARDRERATEQLLALRADVLRLIGESGVQENERERLVTAVDERFGAAELLHAQYRIIPRVTVAGAPGEFHLGAGWRKPQPWTAEAKRALIARGYELTDTELDAAGFGRLRAFEAVT